MGLQKVRHDLATEHARMHVDKYKIGRFLPGFGEEAAFRGLESGTFQWDCRIYLSFLWVRSPGHRTGNGDNPDGNTSYKGLGVREEPGTQQVRGVRGHLEAACGDTE